MIDVVIVNYNTCADLLRCLHSLGPETHPRTVVVDNASSDGSAVMVPRLFPAVRVLARDTNDGYAAAANVGIRDTMAPYVLLLNSDTMVDINTLPTLTAYLEQHPRAALVGPRLLNSDGTLQRSCFPFPSPLQTLLQLGNVYRLIGVLPVLRERTLRTWSHDAARRVPWVLGAALAIRRTAFEAVGGFDPSFFMYSEEVDLCYRFREAGWETHFAPVTNVVHVRGTSTRQQRTRMEIMRTRSTERFYAKHRPSYLPWDRRIMTVAMHAKIWRDRARLRQARDDAKRQLLRDNLAVWQGTLVNRDRSVSGHDYE